MKAFHSIVPPKAKEYENQTDLSPITDDDFEMTVRPFSSSPRIIFAQILSFLLLLGPFRVIFGIIITLFTIGLIVFIRVLMHALGIPTRLRSLCISFARFGVRCLLFVFGITYIHFDGAFDPTARFIVGNHVGLLDPFVIFYLHDCTYPIDSYHRSHHILELVLESIQPIWVDANRASASRKVISDWADNFKRPPVLMFPEGSPNGNVLSRFRDTAFSTPYRVQPVAIRYHMLGIPRGWNTYAYHGEGVLAVLWRLFAMPPSYVSIDILPSISMAVDGKAGLDGTDISINRFLVAAQLLIANNLGVQAIDRLSD